MDKTTTGGEVSQIELLTERIQSLEFKIDQMQKFNPMYVIYVNCDNLDYEEISFRLEGCAEQLRSILEDYSKIVVLPVLGENSRLECLNYSELSDMKKEEINKTVAELYKTIEKFIDKTK